jgi:uncharacterized membrane protein
MMSEKVAPPRAPAFIMGLGLGGFIDGIVFHQILQWHHMLTDTGDHPSNTVAGLEDNTLADGFFHLATWLCVSAAMLLIVHAWQRGELAPPWRMHVGMLLAGWGAFNLVEGLVDHQLLGTITSAMTSVRRSAGTWPSSPSALCCWPPAWRSLVRPALGARSRRPDGR